MYLFSFKYFQNVIKYLVLVFILKRCYRVSENIIGATNIRRNIVLSNCPLFSIASFKVFALPTFAIEIVVTLTCS